MEQVETINDYISNFPKDIQLILKEIKNTIKESAPLAKETISWGMPTFKLHGNLIHFAAFKDHISIFPGPDAINKFKNELSKYETSKGTIRFPFDNPIPFNLIKKIIKYRTKENLQDKEELI